MYVKVLIFSHLLFFIFQFLVWIDGFSGGLLAANDRFTMLLPFMF